MRTQPNPTSSPRLSNTRRRRRHPKEDGLPKWEDGRVLFSFFAPSADRRRGLNSAYMSEGDSPIFLNDAKRFEFDAINWGDLNHDSEIDSRIFRPKEHNPFRNKI